MRYAGVRIAVIVSTAGALWLAAGAATAQDTVISTRIPLVPAETLPATEVPGDPSSGVRVRVDPGDHEAPDPAPQLVVTIRG